MTTTTTTTRPSPRILPLSLLLLFLIQQPSPAQSFALPHQQLARSRSTITRLATTAIITIPTAFTSSDVNDDTQQQQQTVVTIRQASLPSDLLSIQACRRSAYPNKNVDSLLSASKSFCNADQIQRPGYVCFIATMANNGSGKNKEEISEVVLGTADYNANTGIVNNVYVRDYARKNGLADLMMQAVESYHHTVTASATPTADSQQQQIILRKRPLKLTVSSSNIPAISLYKKLGFEAKGAYGLLDGLSSAIPALNFLMEMEKC